MGDELIVAALSLFYADLLKITGPKMMHTQKPNMGDPDDPFDENYLRETSVSDGDFVVLGIDSDCVFEWQ